MNSTVALAKLDLVNLDEQAITIVLNSRLSVRAYFDCSPHCMETAPLQKGLVLILDNEELVEEGIGFGVPVVKYQDKTFFSSSAQMSFQKNEESCCIKKIFVLDAVSRKKIGNDSYINDGLYSFVHKTFEKLYLRNKRLAHVFNEVMELRNVARIRTEFRTVKPRGVITVNYCIQPTTIRVSVDFSGLQLSGCQEVLVLNEQGSAGFEKYADSNGVKLVGAGIGAWEAISANQASLLDSSEQLAFCLQKISGATLYRGWEKTRNRFSWAGLSYSLRPNHGTFDYAIRLSINSKMENHLT